MIETPPKSAARRVAPSPSFTGMSSLFGENSHGSPQSPTPTHTSKSPIGSPPPSPSPAPRHGSHGLFPSPGKTTGAASLGSLASFTSSRSKGLKGSVRDSPSPDLLKPQEKHMISLKPSSFDYNLISDPMLARIWISVVSQNRFKR